MSEGIFGDLDNDTRANRLFTIGMCLGFIPGVAVGSSASDIICLVLALLAAIILAVRTFAQKFWPDMTAEEYKEKTGKDYEGSSR